MIRVILFAVLLVFPHISNGISTMHHDKADETKIAVKPIMIASVLNDSNNTEAVNERQRRLIPYMTFYLTHNYNQPQQPQYQIVPQKIQVQPIYQNKYLIPNYQPKYTEAQPTIIYRPKVAYTPFLESNKLPGQFVPMVKNPPIQIPLPNHQQYQTQITNEPNFSFIFDKFLQMKQLQNKIPQYTPIPQYQNTPKLNIAEQYYTRGYITHQPPTKYIPIDDYDIPEPAPTYKPIPSHVKTIIHTYTPSSIDIPSENKNQNYDNFESQKIYNQVSPIKISPNNVQPTTPDNYKQILVQEIPEKNYNTYVLRPLPKPEQNFIKTYRPIYRPVPYTPLPKVTPPPPVYQPTENPNSLSVILKQLQDSNTLPQTLTADNIDNSIKTLVHILNSLKNTKLQRPIIVDDISEDEDEVEENDEDSETSIDENYPLNTPEGGTPGKAGQDYPAYSKIPQTAFSCKTQRYKGFFGDPDTNCQVWHYCDLNGGQASFLCPNGTIFSQVALTCDWWYNVKCSTTTQLYVLNERLYKYILPFTPKFPEDYSGPLVDKYLALKFKEMEEKMRKQKKGKNQKPADDTRDGDVDKLQIIEAETVTKPYVTEPSE